VVKEMNDLHLKPNDAMDRQKIVPENFDLSHSAFTPTTCINALLRGGVPLGIL